MRPEQLEALEAALLASLAAVRAAKAEPGVAHDVLLGVDEALEQFGIGRATIKAAARRGELEISSGARGKLLVSRTALEAWLKSRRYEPPTKPAKSEGANDSADDWESQVSAKLRSIQGGRR